VSGLVEAATYGNRVEADLARLYLESEGVHAVLFDTEVSNFYGFFAGPFMPIRLMVLDEDLDEARGLLREYGA
jgi:sulfur transfer complex TusBCD TusB component (DsrH family)